MAIDKELRTGDVVWLKSGSPRMVINETRSGWATCAWFTDDAKLRTGKFSLVSLTVFETPMDTGE